MAQNQVFGKRKVRTMLLFNIHQLNFEFFKINIESDQKNKNQYREFFFFN